MVVGDTYTVPLFCLAARRFQVAVAHVEAGLRSFNERSLEEFDRLVGMVGATLHFPPTERAASNLMRAGVPAERIHVVGNPVVDALQEWGLTPRPLEARVGVVVTAHRATNVDDPQRLQALVEILVGLAETGPVTFPIQPRTQARLEAADLVGRLRDAGITMLAPVPHRRMLELVAGARLVVTDSGGLQEEAAWFGVPVVVLRHSTPRWEGIIAGTSRLVGLDVGRALEAALELSQPSAQALAARTPCPYGDGHAAERIAEVICDPRAETQWRLREHDFVGKPPPA
jgi:UDP-N-acetylglucosamine 2-epimerase (non-hydrolysing)